MTWKRLLYSLVLLWLGAVGGYEYAAHRVRQAPAQVLHDLKSMDHAMRTFRFP
jgi:hypothetical protein